MSDQDCTYGYSAPQLPNPAMIDHELAELTRRANANRLLIWHWHKCADGFECAVPDLGTCPNCGAVVTFAPVKYLWEGEDGDTRPAGMNLDKWNYEMLHDTNTQAITERG